MRPQRSAAQGRKRRLLPAAGPWPRLQKKKEGKAGYSAGPGGKGAGLPGQIPGKEKREAFTLFPFYFSSILNPFQMNLNSLLDWNKIQTNSTQNMHQHECSSMYFTLILILFL